MNRDNSLQSWSWQNIISLYKVYGTMIDNFQISKQLFIARGIEIGAFQVVYGDYIRDVNNHILALDTEIARRNNLIGIMG